MRSRIEFPWAAFMVAFLVGCGDSPTPTDIPGPATTMVAVSGTNLSGLAHGSHDLKVRLTDAKGQPVQGAVVNWRVVSGEGSISPTTSSTDAAGVASVSWNLGAWASEQKVVAESNRLPSVEFDALVPTATLAIAPSEVKMWVGDRLQLEAVARDAAGTILSGLEPSWSSSSAAASIAEDGVLTGINAGEVTITARFRGVQTDTKAMVLPVVFVRVWSLDGTDVSGEEVIIELGNRAQAAPIVAESPSGEASFRFDSLIPEGTPVRIRVDARNTGHRRYHPAVIEMVGGELPSEIKVGLVPLRFTLGFGCYAGETVDVSARAVLTPADEFGSFYDGDPTKPEIFGLSAEALPIKVGIKRTDGATEEDADSVWAALQGLEQCIWPGSAGSLYQRVDPNELTGNGLRVNFDFDLGKSLGWSLGKPDVTGGRIDFGAAPSTRPRELWYLFRGLVHHETIHTLGFSHAAGGYPSRMGGSPGVLDITAYDVTYIRLMQLAYELRKAHDIPVENFFTAAARGEELFGR